MTARAWLRRATRMFEDQLARAPRPVASDSIYAREYAPSVAEDLLRAIERTLGRVALATLLIVIILALANIGFTGVVHRDTQAELGCFLQAQSAISKITQIDDGIDTLLDANQPIPAAAANPPWSGSATALRQQILPALALCTHSMGNTAETAQRVTALRHGIETYLQAVAASGPQPSAALRAAHADFERAGWHDQSVFAGFLTDNLNRNIAILLVWRTIIVLVGFACVAFGFWIATGAVGRQVRRLHRFMVATSRRDALTGLSNRASFQQALQESGAAGGKLAVILFDLDRFGRINRQFGSPLGDQTLLWVASTMRAVCGPHVLLARVDGDSFAALISERSSEVDAITLAERLRSAICTTALVGDTHLGLSATGVILARHSGGLALMPEIPASQLLDVAELTLARVKITEPGLVHCASDRDFVAFARRQRIITRLLQLSGKPPPGLGVAFQPILRAAPDGTAAPLIGLEALARWQDAELGDISPDEMFAVAGHIGLTKEFCQMTRAIALREFVALRPALPASARLWINLSAEEVQDAVTLNRLTADLAYAGVKLADVMFEISEELALGMVSSRMLDPLILLRRQGAGLALDDFGAGRSGFSHLLRLDCDAVKLDRQLVVNVDTDRRAQAVIASIVAVCGDIGASLVAEGVETGGQMTALRRIGVGGLQGFYTARPMPPAEFRRWLMRANAAGGPVGEAQASPAPREQPRH